MDQDELAQASLTGDMRGAGGCGICRHPKLASLIAQTVARAREADSRIVVRRMHRALKQGMDCYRYVSVVPLTNHLRECEGWTR